ESRKKSIKSQTPSVPGFPAALLSSATPDVVLFKENHTQPTEAPTLDSKSGEAERICGAPFVCPAPTGPQPPRIIPNHPGKANLPVVIPGFHEWSGNRGSLHCTPGQVGFAPPDFVLRLVAVVGR